MMSNLNKANIDALYQYISKDDESLQGIQWEAISGTDYDTPKSIMRSFIEIFLGTDFTEYVDYDYDYHEELIANKEERKIALAKWFRILADEIEGGMYDE